IARDEPSAVEVDEAGATIAPSSWLVDANRDVGRGVRTGDPSIRDREFVVLGSDDRVVLDIRPRLCTRVEWPGRAGAREVRHDCRELAVHRDDRNALPGFSQLGFETKQRFRTGRIRRMTKAAVDHQSLPGRLQRSQDTRRARVLEAVLDLAREGGYDA